MSFENRSLVELNFNKNFKREFEDGPVLKKNPFKFTNKYVFIFSYHDNVPITGSGYCRRSDRRFVTSNICYIWSPVGSVRASCLMSRCQRHWCLLGNGCIALYHDLDGCWKVALRQQEYRHVADVY